MEDKSTVSLALCRSDLCLSLFISIGDLWVGPSNIVLPGTFQQFQKWKACKKGGRYERGLLILVQYKRTVQVTLAFAMADKHSSVPCLGLSDSAMGDIPLSQSSSSFISLPPITEDKFYYRGLPSHPVLVARTGPPWKQPTGPEAYRTINKELRVVGTHAIKEVWEDNLALKVHALLDSMKVKWTSTDVVRIKDASWLHRYRESSAPVILWIGVMPGSLSYPDGSVVASKCRELLVEYDITDVDVEIRESVVTRSAGPKLLAPTDSSHPTSSIRQPFTTTLGFPICAQSTPWAGGTAGFFISEGGNTERLLLVTARHVVFTSPDNSHFEHKDDSQLRHNIMLFGDASFNEYLESIQAKIKDEARYSQIQERCIMAIEGKDNPAEKEKRQEELNKTREAVEGLNAFYQDISTRWATSESRVLGHVILSPPINVGVGSESYTEDWAIIEVDASKVDIGNFYGNAIDIGTPISALKLTNMMHPNPWNVNSFMPPWRDLLRLKGTIPDKAMRHPTAFKRDNESCLMVMKRGRATGLTIGRANNICSYSRYYYDGDEAETSKEWPILPFDSRSGVFSKTGDSGSVIVDSFGRIGGLIIGGAGTTSSSDITYATPISFLLKCMRDKGLQPNINPVLTA